MNPAGLTLLDQEAFVRTIVDDMPDAIVVADPDRRIVLINPALSQIFGYQAADVVGEKTAILYRSAEEFERQGRLGFNLTAEERSAPYMIEYRRKNGETFIGETIGVPIRNAEGTAIGSLGIIRDISDRVQLDVTLRRLYYVSSTRTLNSTDKILETLKIGSEHFQLPLAIVSEVVGDRYTIKHIVGPEGRPEPGTGFDLGDTYCVHTLNAGGPIGFHRASTSEICNHPCYQKFGLEAYLGAPLLVEGERMGTVNFSGPSPRVRPFSSSDLEVVRMFSEWIGHEIARQRDFEALEQAHATMHRLATVDDLTGARNRREFLERGAEEIIRAVRYQRAMSVVYFDVDHFKAINDAHGHQAGDRVLCAVVEAAQAQLRTVDLIGRLGGEEFAILLPETEAAGAHLVADRLRATIAASEITSGDARLRVTASFGVAELAAADADIDALLARADCALYKAKADGRNRVVDA